MPRFVVLTHDHPTLHWDFMLEWGEKLRTWRLAQPPEGNGPIQAESLPDHRLAYLDYEGPVSGGRGTVARWDAGNFKVIEWNEDRVAVRLAGEHVQGAASVERTTDKESWIFRMHDANGASI